MGVDHQPLCPRLGKSPQIMPKRDDQFIYASLPSPNRVAVVLFVRPLDHASAMRNATATSTWRAPKPTRVKKFAGSTIIPETNAHSSLSVLTLDIPTYCMMAGMRTANEESLILHRIRARRPRWLLGAASGRPLCVHGDGISSAKL